MKQYIYKTLVLKFLNPLSLVPDKNMEELFISLSYYLFASSIERVLVKNLQVHETKHDRVKSRRKLNHGPTETDGGSRWDPSRASAPFCKPFCFHSGPRVSLRLLSLTRRPGQAGGMIDRTTVMIDLSLYDIRLSSPIQRHLPSTFCLKVTWIAAWGISASVGNTDKEEGKPQIKRQMLQSKMRQELWKPKCHWNRRPQMQTKYPIINLRKATTWQNKIFK